MEPGVYTLYVRSVSFGDEDGSGGLSPGDAILEVSSSNPLPFELNEDLYVKRLNAQSLQRDGKLKIVGFNFGTTQDDGEVRIGKSKQYYNSALGQGRLLEKVKAWSDTKIAVKLKVPARWEGQTRYVWIEKDGKKSNFKGLKILAPMS